MVIMKRTPLLALLALAFLLPVAAEAVTMDPVTISLDNPNQVVAAPSGGFITLNFSGTIVVDSDYRLSFAVVDSPWNMSHTNFLSAFFDSAFVTFLSGGNGTYTGNIFSVDVPAGTPADLYAFQELSNLASELTIQAFPFSQINSPDGGPPPFTASAAFSVLVTNGTPTTVPEGGSSMLLLGAAVAGLCFVRRKLA
jgi:hypothetical protein